MPCELLTERQDATLVLTLSDPATRNALSPQACAAGVEALNNAADVDAVRTVVLRGAGTQFCGGPSAPAAEGLASLLDAIRACPKPVLAAVEGTAAGAGLAIALACDLVIAADDARFVPDDAALPRGLPRSLRLQWQWLPDSVDTPRLAAAGLVSTTVPPGLARAEALQWAARLAAVPAATLAADKERSAREATAPR